MEKYFLNIPEINLVATVFYPKLKLDGLQDLLIIYYNALIPIKNEFSPNPVLIVHNVKTYLNNFYNECSLKYRGQVTQLETQTSSSSTKLTKAQLLIKERIKRSREFSSSNQKLENYFNVIF
ncbi:hypothetical protein Pfo_007219 [Paulownia fortunei]|nr:hypothetical protein Pfo_007219 [Paulownia fortunei]